MAGGLGGEVVRVLVDDHGAAQNVRDGKPVGEDAEIGVPAAAEQGRQVPGVAGVLAPIQVQVAAGALKVRGSTGIPLVDMEAEDPGGAGTVLVWEAVDLGGDQDAPLLGKEGDQPGEGGARRSGDVGDGGGGLGVVLHGNHLIEKSVGREEKALLQGVPPSADGGIKFNLVISEDTR